jgi:H+/Cl- antiporter ClcA
LIVILVGVVYMYVTYRSGNEASRRKVLWFFEAAVAALVFSLIFLGVRATLGGSSSGTARAILLLSLNAAYCLTLVVCFAAAVFYAGATSPALVVRKTVAYGATAALLLFTFAMIQSAIEDALVDLLGMTGRFGSAVVATMFGLAFHPLTKRIEALLRKLAPVRPAVPDQVPAHNA